MIGGTAISFFYIGSIAFLIGTALISFLFFLYMFCCNDCVCVCVCLMVAIMIFMWSTFTLTYRSSVGGGLAVALIGLGLIGGLATVIGLRSCFKPAYKHSDEVRLYAAAANIHTADRDRGGGGGSNTRLGGLSSENNYRRRGVNTTLQASQQPTRYGDHTSPKSHNSIISSV